MKYRGSDGWLHDDTAGNRRYQNTESTQSNKPKTDHEPDSNGEGAAACCAMLGACVVASLIGMGMGYGFGGLGGLLAGLGLSLCLPVGIVLLAALSGSKKKDCGRERPTFDE